MTKLRISNQNKSMTINARTIKPSKWFIKLKTFIQHFCDTLSHLKCESYKVRGCWWFERGYAREIFIIIQGRGTFDLRTYVLWYAVGCVSVNYHILTLISFCKSWASSLLVSLDFFLSGFIIHLLEVCWVCNHFRFPSLIIS